ncbi:hypothetical protein [Nodosilinea nodulosa]|uniref:hypothetical protein n=1 Tax=Nodosilinea nodulosa TaxID=416001 RepID=UPI0002E69A0B|nr:hypothetical protein [Nodosilinea nodulosa]
MFIQREKNNLLWGATLAIGAGILLGGGAARVQNQACNQAHTIPGYCLSQPPSVRVARGMVGGAFASGGALIMIELGKLSKR